MFDHLGFGLTDYAASKAFFLEALAPLGVGVVMEGEHGLGLGPDGKPALYDGAFVIGPDGHNVEAVCHRPGA